MCDAPIPGVPLTTRQPAENLWISGNPISHSHVSYIKTNSYIFKSQYTKYMIDYNHSLFTVSLIQKKKKNMFWLCSYVIQDKKKKKTKQNNVVSSSHPICGPICGSTACTGPIPEREIPRQGEQSLVMIISYKGYSHLSAHVVIKHTHIQVKICTFLLECLHVMDENVTQPIPCLEFSPTPSHIQLQYVKTCHWCFTQTLFFFFNF